MKRIVVCADGTWNKPEKDLKEDVASNVLRLARSIKPGGKDGIRQQVFYDWGIGSYHDQISAGATGKGLNKNVMDDYRYIVQNYNHGDEIFLFGFSRGAYTVRSLCGLINNCGILKRPEASLIQAAFDHYKKSGKSHAPNSDLSKKFISDHSYPTAKIAFLGVWDTVGALGIPISFLGFLDPPDEFYDSKLGSNVRVARHALAIDEVRFDFEPTVWHSKKNLDLKQVWFTGVHSDIGGGYKPDKDGSLLSDIPLGWMRKEAKSFGLEFEPHLSQRLKPKATARLHRSRKHIYRLKKKLYREIDHGKSEVLIHKSVKTRWDTDPKYRSRNLKKHIDAVGWPSHFEE